jgi:hypothetical protein
MRFQLSTRAQWDYERSNVILQLEYLPSEQALALARELLDIHPEKRGPISKRLLDLLASELRVPPVKLRFKNEPQKHRRKNGRLTYKEYAYYEPDGTITIFNITAVRKQYLAAKSYLDTLIHEFLHHLDYELLGLQHTYHTRGFYSRLGDLMTKLTREHRGQLELF